MASEDESPPPAAAAVATDISVPAAGATFWTSEFDGVRVGPTCHIQKAESRVSSFICQPALFARFNRGLFGGHTKPPRANGRFRVCRVWKNKRRPQSRRLTTLPNCYCQAREIIDHVLIPRAFLVVRTTRFGGHQELRI